MTWLTDARTLMKWICSTLNKNKTNPNIAWLPSFSYWLLLLATIICNANEEEYLFDENLRKMKLNRWGRGVSQLLSHIIGELRFFLFTIIHNPGFLLSTFVYHFLLACGFDFFKEIFSVCEKKIIIKIQRLKLSRLTKRYDLVKKAFPDSCENTFLFRSVCVFVWVCSTMPYQLVVIINL